MEKAASVSFNSVSVPLPRLERLIRGWIQDGKGQRRSPRTLQERELILGKLLWHLRRDGCEGCGRAEIRAFLAYVAEEEPEAGGRFGNPKLTDAVGGYTIRAYFRVLRAFFRFLVEDNLLPCSPMERMQPPRVQANQIQPFTADEIRKLAVAAARSRYAKRDEALLRFLLDTGCRASEVCALRVLDYDFDGRACLVRGKGDKTRTVYAGRRTSRALWAYVQQQEREADWPLFPAERGRNCRLHLTPSGLLQIIKRLGQEAGIQHKRCSPHTFRHTFAIMFLRSGGDVFTLKELLGHVTLSMTSRYIALANADCEAQHRRHSPVDGLKW